MEGCTNSELNFRCTSIEVSVNYRFLSLLFIIRYCVLFSCCHAGHIIPVLEINHLVSEIGVYHNIFSTSVLLTLPVFNIKPQRLICHSLHYHPTIVILTYISCFLHSFIFKLCIWSSKTLNWKGCICNPAILSFTSILSSRVFIFTPYFKFLFLKCF